MTVGWRGTPPTRRPRSHHPGRPAHCRNLRELKMMCLLLEKSEKLVQEFQQQKESVATIENEYESLKIANAIVGSKEDKHTTKLKINTLIREIDKCIVQLGE